ncbi:MAG: nascent polypeptide-associated complex protein [Thermoplasmataceae archaeon]
MIPGRINSREVKRMMAQMGIKTTDLTDVKRILMEGTLKDYLITEPSVTIIEAKGEKYFQVSGNLKEVPKGTVTPATAQPEVNEEDLKLVIDQTGASREKAIEALKKANGEPAQAIIDLLGK